MEEEIKKIQAEIKMKRQKKPKKYTKAVTHFFNQIFLTVILVLACLITLKANTNLKEPFYKYVFEQNFSFASVNEWYEKKFGSSLPFLAFIKTDAPVFKEKLNYEEAKAYKNGVALTVSDDYLVPNLNKGLVIFIGDKEDYPNTIIVQQTDGIEVWYSNLKEINVSLYDYIEAGTYLGMADTKTLYLAFEKEGEFLDYKTIIP